MPEGYTVASSSHHSKKRLVFGLEVDLGLGMPTGALGLLGVYRPQENIALYGGIGVSTNLLYKKEKELVYALGLRVMPAWWIRPYLGTAVALSGEYEACCYYDYQAGTVAWWEETVWWHFDVGLEVDVSDAAYLGLSGGIASPMNEPTRAGVGRATISMGLMVGARLL